MAGPAPSPIRPVPWAGTTSARTPGPRGLSRPQPGGPFDAGLVGLLGELRLPLGVLGHEGSTVLVGLNGLRLLSRRAWKAPARWLRVLDIPAMRLDVARPRRCPPTSGGRT